MSPMQSELTAARSRIALDIGSTVVKVARLNVAGELESQRFFPRDFEAGIARQVREVLAQLQIDPEREPILACSSANGGLRVGIVCLSKHFSGAALRNQVLLAGANPEFVHDLDEAEGDLRRVDILLVGGGIDSEDAGPAQRRLEHFDPGRYRFGTLVYCANRYLAAAFTGRFPQAVVIDNPLQETLSSRVGSVFECVRRAYLDDLIFKEGVSELPGTIGRQIRPTPEVASRGFLRSVLNQSSFGIVGACIAGHRRGDHRPALCRRGGRRRQPRAAGDRGVGGALCLHRPRHRRFARYPDAAVARPRAALRISQRHARVRGRARNLCQYHACGARFWFCTESFVGGWNFA